MPNSDIKESLKRADIALYQTKYWGRNKSVSIDKEQLQNNTITDYDEQSDQARNELFKHHCKAVN